MFQRRPTASPRRFGQILPWLWIIGPAYLVALAIALLAEPDSAAVPSVQDLLTAGH